MSGRLRLEEARTTAADAADRAGVTIVDLHDHQRMAEVSRLIDEVWGRAADAGAILPAEALTALAHAGGQVSVAERDDEVVGATAALIGLDTDGEVFLHSHVTGVASGDSGRGVGRALKWHQRAWCLERDITRVRWTFDPLVRRNAVFNLLVLGAQPVAYRENVYGQMADALNAGAPTDRLVTEWELSAARVVAAAAGRSAAPDVHALRRAGAQEVLRVGDDGTPQLTPATSTRRLVQVPADIEALRAADPEVAAAWGAATRAAFRDALEAGCRVVGVTRDGWYALTGDRDVHDLADRS